MGGVELGDNEVDEETHGGAKEGVKREESRVGENISDKFEDNKGFCEFVGGRRWVICRSGWASVGYCRDLGSSGEISVPMARLRRGDHLACWVDLLGEPQRFVWYLDFEPAVFCPDFL